MYEDEGDEEEYQLSSNQDFLWEFVPAVCYEKPKFILCKKKKKKKDKSWISRKWHHFTHWVDKHKEPVIAIGAVALGAIIAGVAGGSDPGNGTPSPYINKAGEVRFGDDPPEYSQPPTYSLPENDSKTTLPSGDFQHPEQNFEAGHSEITVDYRDLAEELELVKEELLEATTNESFDNSHSGIKEYARNLVSEFAHELIDDLSEMTKSVGVVGGLVGQFVDENYQEALQETYFHLHESIDRGLGTDIGYLYTQQGKEEAAYLKEKLGIDVLKETDQELASAGLIPPGGALATGVRAVAKGKGAGPVAAAAAGAAILGSTLKPVVPQSVEQPVSVYQSFDKNTGEVTYVGITNNFPRRTMEHWRQKGIEIESIPGLNNLSEYDARATEQALIEIHGLKKNGGTLINRINSIAKKNPIKAEAVKRGLEILKEKEYDGLKDIIQ